MRETVLREWPVYFEGPLVPDVFRFPVVSKKARVLGVETRYESHQVPRGRYVETVHIPYPVLIIRDSGDIYLNNQDNRDGAVVVARGPKGPAPILLPAEAGHYIGSSPNRNGERVYFFYVREERAAPPRDASKGSSPAPAPASPAATSGGARPQQRPQPGPPAQRPCSARTYAGSSSARSGGNPDSEPL